MIIVPDGQDTYKRPEQPFLEEWRDLCTENMPDDAPLVEQFPRRTAPFDARFPNQNQTKNCWQNYVDYQKCIRAKGIDYKPCGQLKWIYQIICPGDWTKRWDEQIEANTFPSDITLPKPPTVDTTPSKLPAKNTKN